MSVQSEQSFFIDGPAGRIEALVMNGKAGVCKDPVLAVLGHPHPLHQGTMHNKVVHTMARVLRDMGVCSIRFNFRGVGKSEGDFADGIGETEDFLAVCRWGLQKFSPLKLWLAGFSFGSFVATKAAQDFHSIIRPVDQLVLVAPPVHYPGFGELLPMSYPCCVIQGDLDDVVEPSAVYQWLDRQNPRPHLIQLADAGHFFHGKLVDMKNFLRDYLQAQHRELFI